MIIFYYIKFFKEWLAKFSEFKKQQKGQLKQANQ